MHPVFAHITSETAALLATQATTHGLSVEAYLQLLLGCPQPKHAFAALSDEAFEALMAEFSSGTDHMPPLPPGFSRKDIYCDHD